MPNNYGFIDPSKTGQFPGSSGYWATSSTPGGYHTNQYGGLSLPGDASQAAMGRNTSPASGYNTAQAKGYGNTYFSTGNNTNPALSTRFLGWNPNMAPGGAGNPNVGPNITTLTNQKSAPIQAAIDTGLQQTVAQTFDPKVNPNVVRTDTKNPVIQGIVNGIASNIANYQNPAQITKSNDYQGGINSGYGQSAADNQSNRNDLSSFKDLFKSNTAQELGNTGQENTAIGDTFNGTLQGNLDANAAARAHAVGLATGRAQANVNRMASFGGLANGNSSYLSKQALDTGAGIYANEAVQQADLARNNLQYVQGQQAALTGVRNNNLNALDQRQLQPIGATNLVGQSSDARLFGLGNADLSNHTYTTPMQQGSANAALLGQISGADNANNFYSTDNAQAFAARQAGLLGQYQGMNNQNNFYGLSQPYNNPMPGSMPPWQSPQYGGYNRGPQQNYAPPQAVSNVAGAHDAAFNGDEGDGYNSGGQNGYAPQVYNAYGPGRTTYPSQFYQPSAGPGWDNGASAGGQFFPTAGPMNYLDRQTTPPPTTYGGPARNFGF